MNSTESKAVVRSLLNVLFLLAVVIATLGGLVYYAVTMPGESYRGLPRPLDAAMQRTRDKLAAHVYRLAGEIGERNYQRPASLEDASEYIESEFRDMGYNPVSEVYGDKSYRNIVVNHYGRHRRNEILVIGAHYDSVWLSPGADDNASGVAILLEIARSVQSKRQDRTIRFIAFTNEEWPFFGRENMGSMVHAENSFERKENIVGMIALEMLGYYSAEPGSQRYPRPLNYFYPDTGNFVAFVSNVSSRKFLHNAISRFRSIGRVPSEGLVAPRLLVPDIRRSDNYAFWSYGFPALMITNTANYRNRRYHRNTDRYDTLDYETMARVSEGLTGMLAGLAND